MKPHYELLLPVDKSWWSSRTSLEKKLVVGLVISVLVVIGLIIAISVVGNSKKQSDSPTPAPTISPSTQIPPPNVCVTPECTKAAAILLESLDPSVSPCDDFYQFACGKWGQVHPIPDDEGKFGTFGLIEQRILNDYRTILEEINVSTTQPEFYTKMKILYTACMDEDTIGEVSLSVLKDLFQRLGGWPIINATWSNSSFDLNELEAYSRRAGGLFDETSNAVVTIYVSFDSKNTTINRIQFDQPYFSLGREYLIHPDKYQKEIKAYKVLITKVAKYLAKKFGSDVIYETDVDEMVNFEKDLANITTSPEDRRDKERLYNIMTLKEMTNNVSNALDWLRLLNLTFQNVEVEITENETVIVWEMKYFEQLGELLNKTDPRTVANYVMWRQLIYLLKHLGKDIENFEFEFEGVISGTKEIEKRWKQCVKYVDDAMGMALGREFVKRFFGAEGKAKAQELIADVRSSFIEMLDEVDWMDSNTKTAAKNKAKTIIENIGYPDWIFNDTAQLSYYSLVKTNESTHLENLMSAVEADRLRELQELRDVPAKKTNWYMTPGTVNAYFAPEGNSINFPAGILQSPFFYIQHPMMMNFGEIGSIIGHEITHGFDDEGRQFDLNGNLREWWPADVVRQFQNKAKCFINMYHKYCPSEFNHTVCLNGNNTLGENIADNGGVKASFRAYQNWVKKQGEELQLPGLEFTPNQLFFLSFANSWCTVIRKEALQSQILYDVHSPGRYRVLGTLSNSEDFKKAFNCPEGSPMVQKERCVLW